MLHGENWDEENDGGTVPQTDDNRGGTTVFGLQVRYIRYIRNTKCEVARGRLLAILSACQWLRKFSLRDN